MKKFFSTIVIALIPFMSISAQSEQSKSYLPEQGDMAFGINAAPVFKYVGNILNGTSDNELSSLGGAPVSSGFSDYDSKGITPDVSIMGKYMLGDNWGVRANIGFMFSKDKYRGYVQDDKAVMLNPFDESKLIDKHNVKRNGMSLMLGTEYRKGSKRIQGVFGAGILFGFVNEKHSYSYANAVTTINQYPTTAWSTWNNGYRTLNRKTEKSVFYGLTGSAGIEWFVAPKVSLGAEVNLSLYYINGGQQYTESEGYNSELQKVEKRTDLTSPGNDAFRFGTENLGGSLYMAFYF